MKKLLICGDSFAADWTVKYSGKGWPNMLAEHYSVTNLAQAGCSEFKIYKQLTSVDLDLFDSIIISHTSPYRIYVKEHPVHKDDPLHKNSDLIYTDISEHSKNNAELLSAIEYFEKYFDTDYAIYVHNLICQDIEKIVQGKNVIHMKHIRWDDLYQFKNLLDFRAVFSQHRGSMNHFDELGNILVFKELMEVLECKK